MKKIITLTISPCVDKNTYTNYITPDDKLRCDKPLFEAGGGGINVSKAINNLGGESISVFPEGGAGGELLADLLAQQNIVTDTLPLEPWTRENLNVVDRETGRQYRFVMPGNPLSEKDTQQLFGLLGKHKDADILVVSGSIPEGTPDHIYKDIATFTADNSIKLIWDTSGEAMNKSLAAGNIFMLKPNQQELYDLMGVNASSNPDVDELGHELLKKFGITHAVISLGAQGALWVYEGGSKQIVPPPVKVVSTVGAGDSQIGGIVLKLAQGEDMFEAVRYGVAVGTTTITMEGTKLASKEDADKLYAKIVKRG